MFKGKLEFDRHNSGSEESNMAVEEYVKYTASNSDSVKIGDTDSNALAYGKANTCATRPTRFCEK